MTNTKSKLLLWFALCREHATELIEKDTENKYWTIVPFKFGHFKNRQFVVDKDVNECNREDCNKTGTVWFGTRGTI